MKKGTNTNPVLDLFRESFDPYDPWGSVVSAMFDIAECLYCAGASIPEEWEFTPSPALQVGTVRDPDEVSMFAVDIDLLLRTGHYSNLIHAGNVLQRYAHLLDLEGRSY